ncbi:MAG: HEAT repeat domain-containing protein, partial [Planctomycetia bacterium]
REAAADPDPTVRKAVVHALGVRRDRDGLAVVVKLAADADPAVRREAAVALGKLKAESAVPALLAALRQAVDRHLEHAILNALIEINAPTATAAGLSDADPAVRRGALVALDQMNPDALTREQVTPLVDSPDPALVQTAIEIITRRPGWADEITGRVGDWLADPRTPSPQRLSMLRGALVAFPDHPVLRDQATAALESDKTPAEVRLLLLDLIARGDPKKTPDAWVAALLPLLRHPDPALRLQSLRAAGAVARPMLDLELAAIGSDDRQPAAVRLAALGAGAGRFPELSADTFRFLAAQLQPTASALDRLTAAEALGKTKWPTDALATLADAVATAGP